LEVGPQHLRIIRSVEDFSFAFVELLTDSHEEMSLWIRILIDITANIWFSEETVTVGSIQPL
ncbi:MAG TPA: hypothetical protein V6C50_07040, partial [Crinalium sp.]